MARWKGNFHIPDGKTQNAPYCTYAKETQKMGTCMMSAILRENTLVISKSPRSELLTAPAGRLLESPWVMILNEDRVGHLTGLM